MFISRVLTGYLDVRSEVSNFTNPAHCGARTVEVRSPQFKLFQDSRMQDTENANDLLLACYTHMYSRRVTGEECWVCSGVGVSIVVQLAGC